MKLKSILIICSALAIFTSCGGPHEQPQQDPNSYSVDFSKYDLGSSGIIQSSDPTFITKIKNFMNGNYDFVKSIECSGDNRVRLKNDVFPEGYGNAQALILGSQNYEGIISLSFNKKLKSVTIKAQQYYNLVKGYNQDTHIYPSYDSQTWDETLEEYVPSVSKFTINEEIWTTLENITYIYDDDGYALPNVPPICAKTFSIDSNELSLTAFESQRVRIYEMSFEFEA